MANEKPDKESKTEQATAKKKQDAIDKGQIPFSREAPIFASLAAMLIISSLIIADPAGRLTGDLASLIENPGNWRLVAGHDAVALFQAVALSAGTLVVPLVLVLLFFSLSASILQNAPRLVAERIKPKLSKISPMSGLKRVYGSQGRTEFLKSLFKFAAVGVVAAVVMATETNTVMNAIFTDPNLVPELIRALSGELLGAICVATALLAAADLVWSRFHWERDLRMTRQEVKDELKQAEGDPLLKSRRLSLARDRSRRRMIAQVPSATLLVVNPTHYAVALRYGAEDLGAPVCVAKGLDLLALRIREVAGEHDIPIFEDKALARSLYDAVAVDQMIPPEFYQAVAELFCFLSRKQGAHIR